MIHAIFCKFLRCVIRSLDDVLTCSAVKKQLVKYAISQPKQIILFDINIVHVDSFLLQR